MGNYQKYLAAAKERQTREQELNSRIRRINSAVIWKKNPSYLGWSIILINLVGYKLTILEKRRGKGGKAQSQSGKVKSEKVRFAAGTQEDKKNRCVERTEDCGCAPDTCAHPLSNYPPNFSSSTSDQNSSWPLNWNLQFDNLLELLRDEILFIRSLPVVWLSVPCLLAV